MIRQNSVTEHAEKGNQIAMMDRVPLAVTFKSPGRTVSEGDFTAANNLTWAVGEIHSNQRMMQHTEFGERIMPGPLVLSFLLGLATLSGFHEALRQNGIRIVALLGITDARFPRPLYPGTTIRVETTFIEARPSKSRPSNLVLKIQDRGFDQDANCICESVRYALAEEISRDS